MRKEDRRKDMYNSAWYEEVDTRNNQRRKTTKRTKDNSGKPVKKLVSPTFMCNN